MGERRDEKQRQGRYSDETSETCSQRKQREGSLDFDNITAFCPIFSDLLSTFSCASKVDSPSLSTLAGQVAIEGALSAKPEIVAESAPAVEIAPEKQALPNDPYPLLYTEKISQKKTIQKKKSPI